MPLNNDHEHEPTSELSFSHQLDGKTTIERWFHALSPRTAHSPSQRTEVPWTAKRCKRLLRPLAAKLTVYKTALEDLAASRSNNQPSDFNFEPESSLHRDNFESSADQYLPRKRIRRTYGTTGKRESRAHFSQTACTHAHSQAWYAVQSAFIPVHDALRPYLPSQSMFSPGLSRRAPSLMLMCLRRLPGLFETSERKNKSDDPTEEMYDFLEDRFGSRNGWNGFAYLLAAHVTTLVIHAFLDGHGERYHVDDLLYTNTLESAGFRNYGKGERFTLLPNEDDYGFLEHEGLSGLDTGRGVSRDLPDVAHLWRLRGRTRRDLVYYPSQRAHQKLIKECQRYTTQRSLLRHQDMSINVRRMFWFHQCSIVPRDVLQSANVDPDAVLSSLWTLTLWQSLSAHLLRNQPARFGVDDSDLEFLRRYEIPAELVAATQEAFVQLWRSNERKTGMFSNASQFVLDLRDALVGLLRDGTPNIKHLLFTLVDDYANVFPSNESMVLALKLEEQWQESLEDEELEKLQVYPKHRIESSATKRVYRFEESLGVWITKTPYDYEERKRQMLGRVREARKMGRSVVDIELANQNLGADEDQQDVKTVQADKVGSNIGSDATPCPPRSIMLQLPPSPPSEAPGHLDFRKDDAGDVLPPPRRVVRRVQPVALTNMILSSDELGG